jgi:16S rRNA (cytosine1402-N4)-methyltransferase
MESGREEYHQPVLLKEVLGFFRVAPGKRYIDATLGLGGHTAAVVKAGGSVLGIEVDSGSLALAEKILAAELKSQRSKVKIIGGNFRDIGRLAREEGFTQVDGVLFDLGMSSWQLEHSGRGFSFQKDEPLDMRMDAGLKVTAADLVNGLYEKELSQLFRKFGEDPWAGRYAHVISQQRRREPIRTSWQLAELIARAAGRPSGSGGRRHPATRVFQALRLAVNDELGNLEKALPQALELIKPGGRLVVISFHSLEDRLVKRFFSSQRGLAPHGGAAAATIGLRILTIKPVMPPREELARNPRSRSAKLRAAEKV